MYALESTTIRVTEQMQGLIDQFPLDKQYQLSVSLMQHLSDAGDQLRMCPDKKAYVLDMYRQAKPEIDRAAKRLNASCKKGCAHCCKIEVRCTDTEVEIIMDHLEKTGDLFDEDEIGYLQKQSEIPDAEYVLSRERDCVFLDDNNECSIYEVRPMACRTYLVASPPEDCNALLYSKGRVAVIATIPTEAMRSVLYTSLPSDRLSNLLLKQYKQRTHETGGETQTDSADGHSEGI